jgi:uncharacterized membrane protein YGL010W
MALINLNKEWSALMDTYADDHQNKINQATHLVGIPLIASSIPVAATIVGLPVAAAMFTVGWGFQFTGHFFEGKKPSFVDDKRQLLVGLMWWTKKVGLPIVGKQPRPEADAELDLAPPVREAA